MKSETERDAMQAEIDRLKLQIKRVKRLLPSLAPRNKGWSGVQAELDYLMQELADGSAAS